LEGEVTAGFRIKDDGAEIRDQRPETRLEVERAREDS
jgi:hypothetical protein